MPMNVSELYEVRPAGQILRILAEMQRPCYKKELERATAMGSKTLDEALDFLLENELVTFTKNEGTGKGRARGFYTITKRGTAFDAWTRDCEAHGKKI